MQSLTKQNKNKFIRVLFLNICDVKILVKRLFFIILCIDQNDYLENNMRYI